MVPVRNKAAGGRREKVVWLWGAPSAMKRGAQVKSVEFQGRIWTLSFTGLPCTASLQSHEEGRLWQPPEGTYSRWYEHRLWLVLSEDSGRWISYRWGPVGGGLSQPYLTLVVGVKSMQRVLTAKQMCGKLLAGQISKGSGDCSTWECCENTLQPPVNTVVMENRLGTWIYSS